MMDEIYRKVAEELNLPKSLVEKTYVAYWRAIRAHITSQPLNSDLSDEEFEKLQPNVNIPSIGKLYVTLDRYHRMKKAKEITRERKNKNATH